MSDVFKTLSPPPDVVRDVFNRVGGLIRGEIFVFSPCDLSGVFARTRVRSLVAGYMSRMGSHPEEAFGAELVRDAAIGKGDMIVTNDEERVITGTVDFPFEERRVFTTASSRGLMRLHPPETSTASVTAEFLGVARRRCATFTDVRPVETACLHELGHYHLRQERANVGSVTRCGDELYADRFAILHASAPAAEYFRHLRTLHALLSPVQEDEVPYWNPLSLATGQACDLMDERAAVLELRHRVGGIPLPGHIGTMSPRDFVRDCLRAPEADPFRACYDPCRWAAQAPSRLLWRLVQQTNGGPFAFPLTEELRERAVEAARRLVPGVFGGTTGPRAWGHFRP